MAVYHGKYVNMDYGDLELTTDLKAALDILDISCRWGSGGTYDIVPSDQDDAMWEAVPCDGPFDTLYFDGTTWSEGFDDEDEDEDGHTESEARTQAGMEGGAGALAEFDGLQLDGGDDRIDEEGFIEYI
jgi:hypothetical protein